VALLTTPAGRATALAASIALATAAFGDLDGTAKARVRDLVPALGASDPKKRSAAAKALAAFGLDALPTAVACADKLKDEDGWNTFATAVAGMGGDGCDAIEKLRADWPKGTDLRFERLEAEVLAVAGGPAATAPVDSPPEVVARIEFEIHELSARPWFAYADPKIDGLVALGRPAFARCVRILRDRRREGVPGVEDLKARTVAKLVLLKLATAEDVPLFAALVRGGAADAAYALRDVATPDAAVVFALAVGVGLDHDLCAAIEKRAPDARVGRALGKRIAACSPDDMYLAASAALAAGRAGAPEAIAPIQAYLAKTKDAQVRAKCCVGLARLGAPDGLAALVATLEACADLESRHLAGEALNEASSRKDYKGGYDAKAKAWRGNFDEAAKAYRAWWESVKQTAKFDPATRKWSF